MSQKKRSVFYGYADIVRLESTMKYRFKTEEIKHIEIISCLIAWGSRFGQDSFNAV